MNDSKDLQKKVEEQEKQIRALKQAIMRLEAQIRKISVVADRAQGQSRRVTEEVRTIQRKIMKE